MELKYGLKRPSFAPYNLNNAVDLLLKREFDLYRKNQSPHPLFDHYDIKAVPYQHPDLENWRNNFKGIEFHFPNTNFVLFGAIDDVWESTELQVAGHKSLHIVDYKATQTAGRVVLGGGWKQIYKRQIEFYQWLFEQNGFKVDNKAFFVYCNAKTTNIQQFNGSLKFDVDVIEYYGNHSWIEPLVIEIHKMLNQDLIPEWGRNCEYCHYRQHAGSLESVSLHD
ncbi:MAG: PD-(D/E)XK nuclease family protein [Flavobacteriales bacterium]|nr:PD-(D/E)XK nuclease family protein [Flavobacteriales bacterium]